MSWLKLIWHTQASVCVLPSSLSCGYGYQQHMPFVAPFKWSKLEHYVVQWSCPSVAHFYRFHYFPVYVDGAHTRSVTRWEILLELENYNNNTSVRCSVCVSVSLLSSVFDVHCHQNLNFFLQIHHFLICMKFHWAADYFYYLRPSLHTEIHICLHNRMLFSETYVHEQREDECSIYSQSQIQQVPSNQPLEGNKKYTLFCVHAPYRILKY